MQKKVKTIDMQEGKNEHKHFALWITISLIIVSLVTIIVFMILRSPLVEAGEWKDGWGSIIGGVTGGIITAIVTAFLYLKLYRQNVDIAEAQRKNQIDDLCLKIMPWLDIKTISKVDTISHIKKVSVSDAKGAIEVCKGNNDEIDDITGLKIKNIGTGPALNIKYVYYCENNGDIVCGNGLAKDYLGVDSDFTQIVVFHNLSKFDSLHIHFMYDDAIEKHRYYCSTFLSHTESGWDVMRTSKDRNKKPSNLITIEKLAGHIRDKNDVSADVKEVEFNENDY